MRNRRLVQYVAGALVLFIIAAVVVNLSRRSIVFSPVQTLNALFERYTENYLEQGTNRTLDLSRGDITTSEGQSYTMLRAVWLGDKQTFDQSWLWTKNNLQHKSGDHLFAWVFGKRADGTYGPLISEGGNNTATDGDEDIALALVFAYSRWQEDAYLFDARQIIRDIWSKEVVIIRGIPYLVANNVEKNNTKSVVVNPSYLSPATYRIFAIVDTAHPWAELVDSSYDILQRSMKDPLDTGTSAGLPPDWILLDRATGSIIPPSAIVSTTTTNFTSNFGFDALRVPFRLALDYLWYQEPRALQLLSQMKFLQNEWRKNRALGGIYSHNGEKIQPAQTPAMYGGTMGYFLIADPDDAPRVYREKLINNWSASANGWGSTLSYYDDNWAWFGIALYNRLLPNLAATIPPAALSQPFQ